jgi:hypothetical protein
MRAVVSTWALRSVQKIISLGHAPVDHSCAVLGNYIPVPAGAI